MTRGEHIAQAVRDYLKANTLTQSKLTGAMLAEIADRALDHMEAVERKKKRLATEEDWIRELESEPHLQGVNVRKELAAAQFWCKNNGRVCTRKFFVNWLNRAEKSAVISPGGAVPRVVRDEAPDAGWLVRLNERFPDSVFSRGGNFEVTQETDYEWSRLPKAIQDEIRKA